MKTSQSIKALLGPIETQEDNYFTTFFRGIFFDAPGIRNLFYQGADRYEQTTRKP